MRNRAGIVCRALLFKVPALLVPSLLAAQVAPRDLASAAWVAAAPGFETPPAFTLPVGRGAPPPKQTAIRWYHGLAFAGMVAALSPQDKGLRTEFQNARSSSKDDFAKALRYVGQPEVYATVALGTVATGLIMGNSKVTRAGARISSGIALGGVVSTLIKFSAGRRRPFSAADQYTFGPFTKADASFPSGHTMTAFALATGVSDEVHSLPVSITMYTLATGVGWSRMNDNKHWLTDVVAGAAIGVTSAKLMNGRWRVFGLSAPRFLLEPSGGAGLAWRATF